MRGVSVIDARSLLALETAQSSFGDASKFGVSKFEEKSAGAESAHAPAEVPTAWGGVVGRSAVGKESAAAIGSR